MKLLFTALLASAFSVVQGRQRELDAAALEARWNMDEPTITYDAASNEFTLDFPTASASNVVTTGMAEEFYDVNCKDDGSVGFVEYIIPAGISAPAGGAPTMTMDGGTVIDPRPQLKFVIDTQVLANDPNIYDIVDETDVTRRTRRLDGIFGGGGGGGGGGGFVGDAPPGGSGATCERRRQLMGDPENRELIEFDADDVGKGVMKMCVRSSLGYTDGTFQEVNFIESLITIVYDLTAGFCVEAFNVEPKERLETTAVKDTYALEAYLCDPTATSAVTDPVRTIPDEITLYNAAGGTDAFNQGALITVCVIPDGPTYSDGIRLDGLIDFTWTRDTPLTSQEAIIGSAESSNGLTSYIDTDCVMAESCHFSSILFADFYISAGEVYGSGNADLTFQTRRRLGETGGEEEDSRRRQLDENEAATSPFDLSVSVQTTEDGPGALKTAGGASFGYSALASATALLGATLLA
jgi:hypothetical protein